MGRSRGAPAGARTSAPRVATPPAPAARPAANTHHHQQQQHAPPQPQVTNVYVQRAPMGGGGMMGGGGSGMLGTMAAVAGGSVIGQGVGHMLFSRDQPAPAAQAQQAAAQHGEGACGPHIKSYQRCLEANAGSSDNCRWAWDMFVQCQEPKGGSA